MDETSPRSDETLQKSALALQEEPTHSLGLFCRVVTPLSGEMYHHQYCGY